MKNQRISYAQMILFTISIIIFFIIITDYIDQMYVNVYSNLFFLNKFDRIFFEIARNGGIYTGIIGITNLILRKIQNVKSNLAFSLIPFGFSIIWVLMYISMIN